MEIVRNPFMHPGEEPFRFEVDEDGERATVRIEGELDLGTADGLAVTLLDLVGRHRTVTVDLRGLDFMDSTGISMLVECNAAAAARGSAFYVVRGPERVQRVLAITGVDAHLVLIDDPD
ncbi:MAG TPA: STAS domain-containing protein [Solirubrobacteraceae bacterium]|nr:STAS domain-containing protein [Solirubrobacteraceae bacterium]